MGCGGRHPHHSRAITMRAKKAQEQHRQSRKIQKGPTATVAKPIRLLLLERAAENLRAAQLMIKNDYFRVAISSSYYAMLYSATALLREEGYRVIRRNMIQEARVSKLIKAGKLSES